MVKATKNDLVGDVASALSIVLRAGLLFFLFGAVSINSDTNAITKLYLFCFLALISLGHFLLTKSWHEYARSSNRLFTDGLVIFVILSLVTFLLSYSPDHSLLGGEGYRLGYLALISAIIVGLSAKQIISRQGLIWYYTGSLVMLIASLSNYFFFIRTAGRLAWPIILSNNLALLLATAFLIGIYLVNRSNWRKIATGQALLFIGIMLTQSRAVLLFTIAIGGAYLFKRYGKKFMRRNHKHYFWLLLGMVVISSFIFLWFAPPRLKSPTYFKTSAIYRLELQQRGLEMTLIRPLTGIGPDAIQFYFGRGTGYGTYLEATMKQGYKFMSIHSLYLDKFIEYGLIAGLIFCALVVRALWLGSRYNGQPLRAVILAIFVLFCLYGLVDFFSLETLALFWLGLFYLNISNLTTDSG